MLEVSKVHTGSSIQSNVTYVEGVERSSICTIRAVMLCMLKVSSNDMYVEACQRCGRSK